MENYQKSALMIHSLFDEDTQERLLPAINKLNEFVADGYSVDSVEVKRRFRIFLLMVRQFFISTKKVPEDYYGENFMRVDDETLFQEAKELYKNLKAS